MTKAIIFDMYETLFSCHRAKMYFGEHIAKDLGLEEARFREVWDATDEARTLGKITFEKVIHDIMVQNDVYSDKLYEKVLTKRRESKLAFNRYYNKELIHFEVTQHQARTDLQLLQRRGQPDPRMRSLSVLRHRAPVLRTGYQEAQPRDIP